MELITFLNSQPQMKARVQFHDVTRMGIPQSYRNQITRTPTLITRSGQIIIGGDIKNHLWTVVPDQYSGYSNDDDDDYFDIQRNEMPYVPVMTPELQAKMTRRVT